MRKWSTIVCAMTWVGCMQADIDAGNEETSDGSVAVGEHESALTRFMPSRAFKIPPGWFLPVPESDEEAAGKFRLRSACRLYQQGRSTGFDRDARNDVTLASDETCLETGHTGPVDGVAYVDVDNPRIWTGVTLPERAGVSGRHYASQFGWLSIDTDFTTTVGNPANWIVPSRFPYRSTLTDAQGFTTSWVNLNLGIHDDTLLPWAGREGNWGGADPRDLTVIAHGARVGYSKVRVQTAHRDRDNVTYWQTPIDTQLDPSVQLVPVQVVLARSVARSNDALRGEGQLALWDRVPTLAESNIAGSAVDREWDERTWVRGVVDPVGGYYNVFMVPDDTWVQCGVQFRLGAYNELELDPLRVDPTSNPNTPRQNVRAIIADFQASASYTPGMPIVLFTGNCDGERQFSESAPNGERYSCISTVGPGRFVWEPATRLASEVGFMLGVQDPGTYCQTDPDNLLCRGGGVTLTAAQCRVARVMATKLREKFFPIYEQVGGIVLPYTPRP